MVPQIDPDISLEVVLAFIKSQQDDLAKVSKNEDDPDNQSYYAGQEHAYSLLEALIVK